MKNKNVDIIENFYISVCNVVKNYVADMKDVPLEDIYEDLKELRSNPNKQINLVDVKPSWFSANRDYRIYYAFLDVYHAMVNYYRYYAQYNKKSEELESALHNWYKVIQPKQNILTRISNRIRAK